jgi:hypothetical protein
MAALVLLILLLVLGAASWAGRTADTRDPDYELGRLLGRAFRTDP